MKFARLICCAIPACSTRHVETKNVICSDARIGLVVAEAALPTCLNDDQLKYWTAFRDGCMVAIASYCPGDITYET